MVRNLWSVLAARSSKRRYISDALGALEFSLEVFPTIDSLSRPADGVCLMLLERACVLLRTASVDSGRLRSIAENAIGLFQRITHREFRNQLSKYTEKNPVARCINVFIQSLEQMKRASFITDFTSVLTAS